MYVSCLQAHIIAVYNSFLSGGLGDQIVSLKFFP